MTTNFTVRYANIDPADLKGRVIRNPAYGGPGVGIHGWVSNPELSQCRKPKFRKALRESLLKEGMRNPIIVYATPAGLFLGFGGSRAQAAKDICLKCVPAIINDYTGQFSDCPEVTPSNWTHWFEDVPSWHEFGTTGFDYHYALEKNRRATYDPAGLAWADMTSEFITEEFPWLSLPDPE